MRLGRLERCSAECPKAPWVGHLNSCPRMQSRPAPWHSWLQKAVGPWLFLARPAGSLVSEGTSCRVRLLAAFTLLQNGLWLGHRVNRTPNWPHPEGLLLAMSQEWNLKLHMP